MKHKSKIFRTYVRTRDRNFILITTSKDLQLKLSALENDGHFHFAMFLDEEFSRNHCDQLLFCFKEDPQGEEKGILITMTVKGSETTFALSPAN